MRPLASFLRPRHFRLLIASSLAVNVLALALPLMTMQVYDRILANHATDTLVVLSCGVLLAALAEFTLRCCRSMVAGKNGAQYEHLAATEALRHVLETPQLHKGQGKAAVLAQDIGASAWLKDYYGGQMMVTMLIDMPFIALFILLEFYLAGWLALVPVAVLGLFVWMFWRQGVKLRACSDARENEDNARYSFISEALQSVHSVKAMCLEAPMARRFEEVQRESGALSYEIACRHGHAASLSYGFSQFMTIMVLCAGAPLVIYNQLSMGALIACVLLSGQVMQPLQRGLSMWIRFQDIALAKKRLYRLLALPRRQFLPLEDMGANHGEVHIHNLGFAYGGADPVIEGANLTIAPGDAIAISGTPGSGKSTLMELIAGIYEPKYGYVHIGGMDAHRIPVAERAQYLAHLPMNGMILRGSIMDNLTGFNPALRAEARAVADQLGIESAVSLLPSGYDTPLEGHMTDVVSPGLKQRVAIARALIHKPRLILYDNADHGMDQESYTRIFELMARLKGKATLVIVSDDKNILSLADYVVELRRGQLITTAHPSSLAGNRKRAGAKGL